MTVEALRDLRNEKDQQVARLESKNKELRDRNADLEARLSHIEALVAQLAAQQGLEQ